MALNGLSPEYFSELLLPYTLLVLYMTQATCGSTVLCPILLINHRLTILICLNPLRLILNF